MNLNNGIKQSIDDSIEDDMIDNDCPMACKTIKLFFPK